jgi:hypothetical protein
MDKTDTLNLPSLPASKLILSILSIEVSHPVENRGGTSNGKYNGLMLVV